jgi:cation transport ATPase
MHKVESLTRLGLRSTSGEKTYWIGNQNLMEAQGVSLSPAMLEQAAALQQSGKTLMWIAEG